jgi:hypothetical protein
MKSRLHARMASVALLLWFGHLQVPASAQELSGRELKKAVKQAGKAYEAGRWDEAIGLYDQILASTSGTGEARGEALYASAMIRLSPTAGHQDVDRAGEHLGELAAFPHPPHGLEIAAARALLARVGSARAEAEREVAELEARLAGLEAEHQQAEAQRQEAAAGESAETDDRVRSLESRLRKAKAETSECRTDLAQKEQALQKLRDALVGGS